MKTLEEKISQLVDELVEDRRRALGIMRDKTESPGFRRQAEIQEEVYRVILRSMLNKGIMEDIEW